MWTNQYERPHAANPGKNRTGAHTAVWHCRGLKVYFCLFKDRFALRGQCMQWWGSEEEAWAYECVEQNGTENGKTSRKCQSYRKRVLQFLKDVLSQKICKFKAHTQAYTATRMRTAW